MKTPPFLLMSCGFTVGGPISFGFLKDLGFSRDVPRHFHTGEGRLRVWDTSQEVSHFKGGWSTRRRHDIGYGSLPLETRGGVFVRSVPVTMSVSFNRVRLVWRRRESDTHYWRWGDHLIRESDLIFLSFPGDWGDPSGDPPGDHDGGVSRPLGLSRDKPCHFSLGRKLSVRLIRPETSTSQFRGWWPVRQRRVRRSTHLLFWGGGRSVWRRPCRWRRRVPPTTPTRHTR